MTDENIKTHATNILIVDDVPENLQLLTSILKEEDYKVRPASSGAIALQTIAKKIPDLILLDIQMPEMNGYQVCEELKRHSKTRDIPIIFISALCDVGDKVKAFNVGGVDYINKPFQFEEVKARVATHLKLKAYQNEMEKKVAESIEEINGLNQEIIETQRELIFTMGEICESRSKETGKHVKRVAEYSYLLAMLSNCSEEEAQMIHQASPMHDIGKVAIADAILHKEGSFTPDEWETMKTHTTIGHTMLSASHRPLLKMAATIALEHHEKWDGSGYPKGLVGEKISLTGRVTAIADVFDALGSARCYKEAWELPTILDFLKQGRGTSFDPHLIDVFFEHLDKFLEIREQFTETSI